jgi:hypothetical protein
MNRGWSQLAAAGAVDYKRRRFFLAALLVLGATVFLGQPTTASAKAKNRACRKAAVATEKAVQVTPTSAVLVGKVNACGTRGLRSSFVVNGKPGAGRPVPFDHRFHTVTETLTGLTPGEHVTYLAEVKSGHHLLRGQTQPFFTGLISITTDAATSVGQSGATLNATVNGHGAPGLSAAFVWSAAGGSQQTTPGTPLPADAVAHTLTVPVNTLTPGTVYTFDVLVSTSNGPLVQCHCALTFTTLLPPPTSLQVTAPPTAAAGQAFSVSATGSAGAIDVGDVTAQTTFTMTPDGSCTGASCTATTAGAHTVDAADGSATGTASTTINAGPLDHLQLSPATANVCAAKATVGSMEFLCGAEQLFQSYTAEGFDHYGNDLGDETAASDFSIPSFDCGGPGCGTRGTVGDVTVTASLGSATGTATLTGDLGTPTCEGTHYDVNNDTTDGCEVADSGVGVGTKSAAEAQAAAASAPECDSGTNADINISGVIPSDTRVHADPAITGFDPTTGSTPDWFYITPIFGQFCNNDIVMTLTTSGEASAQNNHCYKLTVITDMRTLVQTTGADGTASVDNDTGGQFSDGTKIDVEVSKTCSTTVTDDVAWTLSGHL